MQNRDKLYIDGAWVPSTGTGTIEVINSDHRRGHGHRPRGHARGRRQGRRGGQGGAFPAWSQTSVEERAKYLQRITEGLQARMMEIANLIAQEVGMPLNLSMMIQAGLPTMTFGSMAGIVDDFPFEEQVGNSLVVREPVGVVGCITPWNYPLHQIAAKVAPALAAGCTVVLKPSEVAPLNAFILAEIIDEVGLPAGVFNLVTGVGPVVGEAIAAHPDVDMVSFTGSTRAGKRVSELAAARRSSGWPWSSAASRPTSSSTTPTSSKAVTDGVGKCFLNSGQTCSASRACSSPVEAGRGRADRGEGGRELHAGRPVRRRHAARAAGVGRPARAGARLHPEGHRRGRQAAHRRRRGARGPRQGLLRAAHRVLRGDATT